MQATDKNARKKYPVIKPIIISADLQRG